MKRLFFRNENVAKAARTVFGKKDDFNAKDYEKFTEIEITVQDDGRYAVWENHGEDSDLLQDTRKDPTGMVEQLMNFADEIREEL